MYLQTKGIYDTGDKKEWDKFWSSYKVNSIEPSQIVGKMREIKLEGGRSKKREAGEEKEIDDMVL